VPTALRSLLAALVATAAVVGGGVVMSGPEEEPPAADPPAPSITLADLDTTALAARRAAFCDALAPEQVTEALGGEATGSTSYENGDRAPVAPDVTDVAHEFGCTWTGADGTEARAWVFAPPVTAGQARRLARAAVRTAGCAKVAGAPALGTPSVGVACTVPAGQALGYRGLLGDAWLACSLTGAGTDLAERTDRWCAAVVTATTSTSTPG